MGSVIDSIGNGINNLVEGAGNLLGLGGGQPGSDASNQLQGQGQVDFQLQRDQFAWAKEMGQQQMDLTNKVTNQQMDIANQNQQQAMDQWNRYKTTFAPVEDQVVKDAMNYDSADEMARVRQDAAGNANSAFDAAQTSRNIGLEHMGVNPNSGRFVNPGTNDLNRAVATADSMNRATAGRKDAAIGLRAGAANFGRNMPNTAAQAFGLATAAGNSSVGNMNSTVNSMGQVQGTPVQFGNLGDQAVGTAGNLDVSGFNAGTNRINALLGKQGLLGTLLSDERLKEEKTEIDEERALVGLKRIPVTAWKYKDGVADSGRHVGAMAQDVHREFGDRAAPGGTRIDPVSMFGLLHASVKALAKEVDRLKVDRLTVGLEPVGAA